MGLHGNRVTKVIVGLGASGRLWPEAGVAGLVPGASGAGVIPDARITWSAPLPLTPYDPCTKSLRDSPLRGVPNREHDRQRRDPE